MNRPISILRKRRNNSYLKTFCNRLTKFLQREAINFSLHLLYPFFWIGKKIIQRILFQLKTGGKNKILSCPVRGLLTTQLYDSTGNFTEEYYRIEIIKKLLKSGFSQSHMNFHHKIQIGHGGKNSFIPDLVIKNKSRRGYFLVLEVKKNSNKIAEALLYQLNPGIKILNSQYGIYYDGSIESSCFRHDGSRVQNFNFVDIPTWFYNEWKSG